MAHYEVRCTSCGHEDDQVHPMPKNGGAPDYDPCARCSNAVKRIFRPIAEVGTGNRMHQIADSNLCPQGGRVVFNTRAEWQAAMKRQGVRPMEAGEARDQVRFERERKERCDRELRVQLEHRVEKAIEKAMSDVGGA